MSCRRKRIILVLGALYLATWVCGGLVYRSDMDRRLADEYATALAVERSVKQRDPAARPATHASGPTAKLNWCVPLLPGVLLVDSEYNIEPLWAHAGLRIVLCYGAGAVEHPLWIWIA